MFRSAGFLFVDLKSLRRLPERSESLSLAFSEHSDCCFYLVREIGIRFDYFEGLVAFLCGVVSL